jgi:acyl-CoA synthetase (AMP-forming)/AMP-acid ligase II
MNVHEQAFGTIWQSLVREDPAAPAVADACRRWSRLELDAAARRCLSFLLRHGVTSGDRVALLCNNRVEVVATLLACGYGGLIYSPLNILAQRSWLSAVLADAEPAVLLYDDEHRQLAESLAAGRPNMTPLPVEDAVAEANSTLAIPDVSPETPFLLLYTSGTTGNPKGVLLSHLNVAVNASNLCSLFEFDRTAVAGLFLPHCFTGGLNCSIIPCLTAGGLVYFHPATGSAREILDLLSAEKITHIQLVPTQIFRLLDELARGTSAPPSIRTIGYGSAPMPPERLKMGLELLGPVFAQSYGLTECTCTATCLQKADHQIGEPSVQRRLASAGLAVDGIEVRVMGDDGSLLPPGQDGEVVIRGPINMMAYWRNPEATAEALRGGWLHSGDIGHFDGDGFLYIQDRKKDLIYTGGMKVVPSVVEAVLFQHLAVLEVAVIGVLDPLWGEAVVAYVVRRQGMQVGEDELMALVRAQLAPYERPKRLVFTADLPKNPNGKILRRQIRESPPSPLA